MKKYLAIFLGLSLSSFGIAHGFSILPPLEKCLAEYKAAYKEFEPEAQYTKVKFDVVYERGRTINRFDYITTADIDKLNRYLKAWNNLNEVVIRRLLIKSCLVGFGGTLASLILDSPILKQRALITLQILLSSLFLVMHENYTVKEKIPYYHYSLLIQYYGHSDLIKHDDLFSQSISMSNVVKLLVSSGTVFLASSIALIASKFLLKAIT
jgi:hypothetical protein